jgi:cobalt-zinc-cadmium resistance protein CzcA
MAWTVTSALIGSLVLSLTLVPLLCYFFLQKHLSEKESWIMRVCHRLYEPMLEWALRRKLLVIALAMAALLASFALVPKLGTEFLPS